MKRKFLSQFCLILIVLCGTGTLSAAPDGTNKGPEGEDEASSAEIIQKYLQARTKDDKQVGASMEVDIDASVPKLKENGKLHALRKISQVGQITYRVLAFQGQSFVKKEIIARYLQAETQNKVDGNIDITPANYKFRYKGERQTQNGSTAHVFQLQPRKKRVGLFKGEMWLDASAYLPVFEKGRLVKNPSIFFKKVDFERGFTIQNGHSIPSYITSTIDTRLVGRVELNINFSNFSPESSAATGIAETSMMMPH